MSFVDNRIVKMVFDSAKFEQGIAKTLSLLDQLQNSLLLKGASTGLDNLQKTVTGFNIGGLANSVDIVADRFTTLGVIGTAALVKITNQAIDAGERLLKSLSIDQIAAGWQKFGDKTTSVGTLVSQGNSLELVNEQMDRLNWFTDETSYNFTDMVSNIAKFTASGQGLEESVTMMEGIALWAAASGQNASTASRAMYQLSQAMGSGVMRKEDWKSIQNASMDTDEFRQVALDTAVALGKLKKTGEDTYKSLVSSSKKGGQEFKKSQFADSLTEGLWFDTDVMAEVYKKYGEATTRLKEYADANDTTASEAIAAIEEQDKALAEAYSKENNVSIEEATKALIEQGKILDPVAIKWFKAGQEARTFGDVIDSVKDAVSTQFMNIFQDIFGNYEEATKLFTNLANELWEIFAGPLNQVKEMLDMWHDFGGRTHLLYGLQHAWEAILALTDPIKEAFANIFPNETTWQSLVKATFEFSKFTNSLKISDEVAENLKRTFQGVFSVFDLVGQVVSAVARTIGNFLPAIGDFAGGIFDATGSIGDFITDMAAAAKENDFFYNSIQQLIEFVSPAFETLKNIIDGAVSGFESFTGIDLHIPTWKEFCDTIGNIKITLQPVLDVLKAGADGIHNFFESLNAAQTGKVEGKLGILEKIGEIFGKIAKILGPVLTAVKNAFGNFLDYFSSALDKVDGNKVAALLGGGLFAAVIIKIKDFIDGIKEKLQPLESIKEALSSLKDGLLDTFGAIQTNLKAGTLLKIAVAIGVLAASLIALSSADNLGDGLAALGGIMLELATFVGMLTAIEKLGDNSDSNIGKVTTGLVKMAIAVGILSKAVLALRNLKPEEMGIALSTIGILLVELGAFAAAMEKNAGGVGNAAKGMIQLSVSILVLSAACKVFATMSWNDVFKGLAGIGALLFELGAFVNFAGEAKHILATAASMIGIAAALTVLTGILFIMGKTATTMGDGLGVLVVLLIELALALALMQGSLAGSAALLIAAGAIMLLTPALILLGTVLTGDAIARALIALAGGLLVMGVAAAALGAAGPIILLGAAALLAFGAALVVAGAGLGIFGAGLTAFVGGVVGSLAIIGAALEGLPALVAGILISIVSGVMSAITSIAGIILDSLPTIMAAGAGIILAILNGINTYLPQILSAAMTTILTFILGVLQYLPQLVQTGILLMTTFINAMADGIRDNTDMILGAMGNLVSSLIELIISGIQGLVRKIPGVGDDLANMLEEVKTGVRDTLAPEDFEEIAQTASDTLKSELEAGSDGIKDAGQGAGEAYGEGVQASTDSVDASAQAIIDSMQNGLGGDSALALMNETGGTDITEFLTGAGSKSDDITSVMSGLATTAAGALGNGDGQYTSAGDNAILGFIGGLGNHDSELAAEANRLGQLALNSLKSSLAEASPSKKMEKIGDYGTLGYINGLEKREDQVEETAKDLGETTVWSLEGAVKKEYGALDFAGGAIDVFMNKWAMAQDGISNVAAFQVSKDAVELLALQIYNASQTTTDAVDTSKENAKKVEDIVKDIKKAYTDMRNSIKQTIDSQTDMLSMFDFGDAINPEDMLENMESNLLAIDTYYQNIDKLTERRINEGLLKHLQGLGPKGAAQMESFIKMTDEQFDRANQMWEEKGAKLEMAADHVMGALTYSAVQTAGGFVEGLNPAPGEQAAQVFIEAALNKMRETTGVNLQNFQAVGEDVANAVADGISEKSSSSKKKSNKAAKDMSDDVVGTVDSNIKKEDGVAIGTRLCEGIAQGLRNGIEIACTAAEEVAHAIVARIENALGIASPSKVFAELGYYSDLGLANGLSQNSYIVREAGADAAKSVVNEMTGVFGRIADIVDGNIDLDPTIRPVLDLTNLEYGASQIGSLLGMNDPYAIQATAGLSGIQNGDLVLQLGAQFRSALSEIKGNNDLPPVNINIYPREGQDAREIADYVAYKLNHDVLKRRAVYGGT